MKKSILSLLIVISLLMLCSCTAKGGKAMTNEDKTIDERFEQIVNAIKNQDKNALKSMFSIQAVSQFADFDNQITALFDFIQGEIKSWKRTGGPGGSEGNNDDGSGRVWKEIRATYTVITSEQEYFFSLQEITKHSQDANRLGVSSLCVIKSKDWEKDYIYWGDLGVPKEFKTLGIYLDSMQNAQS